MRDIWAAPPGDDGSIRRQRRRTLVRAAALHVATFSLFVGSITYAAMQHSTAVSTTDVLDDFRASQDAGSVGEEVQESARRGKQEDKRKSGADASEGVAAEQGAAPAEPSETQVSESNAPSAPESAAAEGTTQPTEGAQEAEGTQQGPRTEDDDRPTEGVYTWTVEGYEKAPGVERQLPSRSHRVITHSSGNDWTEHHIFSKEKEMWFNLRVGEDGVSSTSSRNKVVMGPVTVDRTVTFNPPVPVSRYPFKLGTTWKGSWSGKTSGTYTARTFEHTWIEIEGERVEVWGAEVIMTMKGEVEGRVVTRTWVSPKYNLAVKQYQETNVESGPGSYYCEWTGQTTTIEPRT